MSKQEVDCEEEPTKDDNCIKVFQTEPCRLSEYRFPTMQLLPIFLDVPTDSHDIKISPSVFMKEMSFTTEERMNDLMRALRRVHTLPGYSIPSYFRVTPQLILFQNTPLHAKESVSITITNAFHASKHLKVNFEAHSDFNLKTKTTNQNKLAAGRSSKFVIEFTPSSMSDYFHKIKFVSDADEEFSIPIIAICPRQMLDLPDRIQLPLIPVKVESKKTLIIRNIGSFTAVANFIPEWPFQIEPNKICLKPDEMATLTVSFYTSQLGTWKNKMIVMYETGEVLTIELEGTSELGNVYLSTSKVEICDTYVEMKRQEQVTIHNKTDHILKFQWQLFPTMEYDFKILNKLKSVYDEYQEIEKNKVADLKYYEIYNENMHSIICSRISKENIGYATSDNLFFQHDNFEIYPLKGEIWPGGICNCSVAFSSKTLGKFETCSHLEIDGSESRLPLHLSCTAIGPKIRFTIDSIDIGEIHLLQVYSFQLMAENNGDIVGTLCFARTEPKFSSTISCSPLFYKIQPGDKIAYSISISRPKIGKFYEEINFEIFESEEKFPLLIKGNVIEPPLIFSEKVVDFGVVPLGFELIKTIRLINLCDHPFEFSLEVASGHWEEEAVRAWDFKQIPQYPKQFSVYPSNGFILDYQHVDIKVVALLNLEHCIKNNIKLSVWDNDMDGLTLPIQYTVSDITVQSLTPEIFIDFAFIDNEYYQEITIINESTSAAFYNIFPDDCYPNISVHIEETRGVIVPFGQLTIHVKLKVSAPEIQFTRILMQSFGIKSSVEICCIKMNGIYPILNVEPLELDWGDIVVLTPSHQKVFVQNLAPVPTKFNVYCESKEKVFNTSIEPDDIKYLEGNGSVEIEVTATLRDPIFYNGEFVVSSLAGEVKVSLTAKGIGFGIITVPCLSPSFNFGYLICGMKHTISITMINKSTVGYELTWSASENISNWSRPPKAGSKGNCFSFDPYKIILNPEEETSLTLKAFSNEERVIEETYYCFGIADVTNPLSTKIMKGRTILGDCLLQASFLNPKLILSKSEVNFCIQVAPDDPFPDSRYDTVTITPEFTQEVIMDLSVKSPFQMVQEDGFLLDQKTIIVKDAVPFEVTLMFDTSYKTDGYSWSADGALLILFKNLPSKAILPLHGEVQYPNIVLSTHFIDFGSIHKYSESYQEITMRNMSSFDLQYCWEWSHQCIKPVEQRGIEEDKNETLNSFTCSEETSKGSRLDSAKDNYENTLSTNIQKNRLIDVSLQSKLSEFFRSVNILILEVFDHLNEAGGENTTPLELSSILEEDRIFFKELIYTFHRDSDFLEKLTKLVSLNLKNKELPINWTSVFKVVTSLFGKLHEMLIKEQIQLELKDAVIPFINKYFNDNLLVDMSLALPSGGPDLEISVDKLVDITPSWGVLLSGQDQVIGTLFKSNVELNLNALAICKIYGGPTERVKFKAICAEAVYYFSRNINFGFIPFCEVSTAEWIVSNECAINILYRIIKNTDDIISVDPMEGVLNAFSHTMFTISCLPLYNGPANTSFYIELATIEVAEIKIEGMATMPQVSLNLPELESKIPLVLYYVAVSNLSHPAFDWSKNKAMIFSSNLQSNLLKSSINSSKIIKDDWEIINLEDDMPLGADIQFALEREYMTYVVRDKNKIKSHSTAKSWKQKFFNDCILPAYDLDFGSVLLDSKEERKVQIQNYKYLDAKLCLSLSGCEDDLKKYGVEFIWTTPCTVEPEGVAEFIILLHPKSSCYEKAFYRMSINFVLQVSCGPSIPIEMKALIVQPELSLQNLLDFGDIKCSHALTLPVHLKNIGTVDAEWFLIDRPVKKKTVDHSSVPANDAIENPFSFGHTSGIVSPGTSQTVMITYLPLKQGVFERIMEVHIKKSKLVLKCKLRGSSMEPKLTTNLMKLDFGTVYPYSAIYEIDIIIFNPCPFCVTVILTDEDSQEELENRILRSLCNYYKTDRMYLPLEYCDIEMEPLLFDMYEKMAKLGSFLKVSKSPPQDLPVEDESKVISTRKSKKSLEGRSNAKSFDSVGTRVSTTSSNNKSIGSLKRKKKRSTSKISRKSYTPSANNSIDDKTEKNNLVLDTTLEEKDALVNDYINWLHNIPDNDLNDKELIEQMTEKFGILEELDDVGEFILSDTSSNSIFHKSRIRKSSSLVPELDNVETYKKGTMVIFYGAPYTDSTWLAHKYANMNSLKVINLDSLIVALAACCHNSSAVIIRDIINSAYNAALSEKASKIMEDELKTDDKVSNSVKLKKKNQRKSLATGQYDKSRASRQSTISRSKRVSRNSNRFSMSSNSFQEKYSYSGDSETDDIIIDPIDDLQLKIDYIISYQDEIKKRKEEDAAILLLESKPVKSPKIKLNAKSGSKSKESKKSSDKSDKNIITLPVDSSQPMSETFLDISLDLISDLISCRLKLDMFESGIVVDKLCGTFIRNAPKCTSLLLNIAGRSRNIFFINISNCFETMELLNNNRKKYQEKKELNEAGILTKKLKTSDINNVCQDELINLQHCFQALDLFYTTHIRNKKEEEEAALALLHPPQEEIKETEAMSTEVPSSKKTSRKNKSKQSDKKKTAKGKKKSPVKLPVEEVIPPEVIEKREIFRRYTTDFAKIVGILESHDRLKSGSNYSKLTSRPSRKRESRRSSTKTARQSRAFSSTVHKEARNIFQEPIISSKVSGSSSTSLGVPLVIINNANIKTELDFLPQIKGLKNYLPFEEENSEITDITKKTKDRSENKYFWYDKPDILVKRKINKAFTINNYEKKNDRSKPELLVKVKPTINMPSFKEIDQNKVQVIRRISAQKGNINPEEKKTENLFQKKLVFKDVYDDPLMTRVMLGTSMQSGWTISFYPEEVGQIKENFRIKLFGWPEASYSIRIVGNVQIPDIIRDPVEIFSKVIEEKENFKETESCFVKETNTFNFGIGFCCTEKQIPKERLLKSKFKFTNPTKLDIELEFSIINNANSFELETPTLSIKPGESKYLKVWALPKSVGFIQDQLTCCIANNPDPFMIHLSCTGIKGQVSINPKEVLFDKVLVKNMSIKSIVITNMCGLPLYWNFDHISKISKSLSCLPCNGKIEPCGCSLVHFKYNALHVETIDEHAILQVSDLSIDDGGEVLQLLNVPIKVESYDVIVNICFPDSHSKQLDYGHVRVYTDYVQSFTLKNNGHYNINYKIEFEKLCPVTFNPKEIFTLSVDQGILLNKGKELRIQVTAGCNDEINLDNSPLLKVILSEGNRHVANLTVPVSIHSHFTKFEINPKDEIGFGSVLVGETKVLNLTIENTGMFEFSYNIIPKHELDLILEANAASVELSTVNTVDVGTKITSSKGKKTSVNEKKLVVGPFVIHNLQGLLKKDASAKIKISCSPNKQINYKEVILVQANCVPEALRYGFPINILASGCLPSVDFTNISHMYRDAIILTQTSSLCNFKPPDKNGLPQVYYSEESGLIFSNVIVSTVKEMKIYLHSTSMVSSTVHLKIFDDVDCFAVEPDVIYIPPYNTEHFTLSFSPKSIDLVENELNMKLEIPYGKPIMKCVKLSGQGCVPLVELVSPIKIKSNVKSDKSIIDFGTCLLDFHVSNILTFRNTGLCLCKFILEMSNEHEKPIFTMSPLPEYGNSVQSLDDGNNFRLSCEVSPLKDIQISCVFAPIIPLTYTSYIQVLIVDNPYEFYKITLHGRGYQDHVTLEGLPFVQENLPSITKNSSSTMMKLKSVSKLPSNSSYLLDFGNIYVGRPVKSEFKLRNHEESWIRFTWELTNTSQNCDLFLYPRVGHLSPKGSLNMYAVIYPSKISTPSKISVRCIIEKISLFDPCMVEWNSNMKTVAWLKHEDKYLRRYKTYCHIPEDQDEPAISDNIKLGDIKLQIEYESDVPSIKSDKTSISFPDTLICQGSSNIVSIKNISRVEANFKCNIVITKAVPNTGEAQPIFSAGLLCDNVYPNIDTESTITTPSLDSCSKNKYRKDLISTAREDTINFNSRRSEICRNCPFIVSPEVSILSPGQSSMIEIKFQPMQMFSYNARINCVLEGTDDEGSGLSIDIEGSGLTSFCHLEIEDNVEILSDLEYPEGTKAIVTDSIGLPALSIKRFNVINPTDEDYDFEWIKSDITNRTNDLSEHLCSTPNGVILAHKMYQMEFNFFSKDPGKYEHLWMISIPLLDMQQYVLFITNVREPCVRFIHSTVTLNPTIAGILVTGDALLQNEENLELKFKVDKCSLFSDGRYEKLEIEPMSDIISPFSTKTLKINFTPNNAGEIDFIVKTEISKTKEPLCLRVITCCYCVEANITYIVEGTTESIALSPETINKISIGHLEMRVPKRVKITVKNKGKVGFFVELHKKDKQTWKKNNIQLECLDKTEFIQSDSSSSFYLTLSTCSKSSFQNLPLLFQILKGPEYKLSLSGDACGPEFIFSFSKFDFGPRFIQKSDECYYTTTLEFKNEDEVSLEIEKITKDTEILKVELEYCVVPPRSALNIVIHFSPKTLDTYSELVEFLVNGIYSNIIEFTGVGVPLKVELMRAKDKFVDFGTVLVGQTVNRSIEMINKSVVPATLRLRSRENTENNYTVNIKPKELTLLSDKTNKFTVSYTPIKRGVNLTEKIWYEMNDYEEVLVIIEGRGVGADFHLDREMIPFGVTVLGSSNTVKLALINSGDFGARFQWDFCKATECFKISPTEGYSTPGSYLTFDITFTPKANLPKTVRNKVFCVIENFKSSLSLVLTGSYTEVPPVKEFVKLVANVRQKVVNTIPIYNYSSEKWVLYPVISGIGFGGDEMVTILPKTTLHYEVSYLPMTMSDKDGHEGNIFFAFPDGQSKLYGLKGTSNPPLNDESVTWTTPAKKSYQGNVFIRNWIGGQSQRFAVSIECKTKGINSKLYKIYGNAHIEVAPTSQREYQIHFFCYIPANLTFSLKYQNEANGEYGILDIVINVTEVEVLEDYVLETQVRKAVDLEIPFYNPLDTKQIVSCNTMDFQLTTNTPLSVPPKLSTVFKMTYFPISVETCREMILTITSENLGDYLYKIYLTAKPAALPAPQNISTYIGKQEIIQLIVSNFTPIEAIFKVQLDSKSLSCENIFGIENNCEETLEIIYEPFVEGKENVTVLVKSETAGIFEFPLVLNAMVPVPQGPFEIYDGDTITIYFKNVFMDNREFIMISESEFFIVKNPKRMIKAKEETSFEISMMKKEDLNKIKWKDFVIASKLIISQTDNNSNSLSWVYYIKGILDDTSSRKS